MLKESKLAPTMCVCALRIFYQYNPWCAPHQSSRALTENNNSRTAASAFSFPDDEIAASHSPMPHLRVSCGGQWRPSGHFGRREVGRVVEM